MKVENAVNKDATKVGDREKVDVKVYDGSEIEVENKEVKKTDNETRMIEMEDTSKDDDT